VVSAEWGEPLPCEFCGTPTKITYFACTYGPEEGDFHPIFEESCFRCARVKLGIKEAPANERSSQDQPGIRASAEFYGSVKGVLPVP
jgi:hypothetical protein